MPGHDRRIEKTLGEIAAGVNAIGTPPAVRDTARTPAKQIAAGQDDKMPIFGRVMLALGGGTKKSAQATAIRRTFPIMGYVGPNGGGKSLAMVKDTLPSLDRGRTVLSTVRLLDRATGLPHPSYVPFTDFDQLLLAEHCDVLMDEVVGIANSRSAASLSPVVQNLLVQLRRRDIVLRWSAPNWARADKIIREVTQAVTECRGSLSGRAQRDSEGEVRLWRPKRLFNFRTFDTVEFEEWSAGKRDKVKPVAKEWMAGPGSDAFASYDTLDAVSMVSHAGEDGMCQTCGKRRRVEYCKGHDDHPAHGARDLESRTMLIDSAPGERTREFDPELAAAGTQTMDLDGELVRVDARGTIVGG
jgi:hypothetical protein